MKISSRRKESFQKLVWDFYRENKRSSLPWRKRITPYKIWISEVMLQQTQADRVVQFFNQWMKLFPDVRKLAQASQVDLLRAWKGLGYNSRAIRLKRAAQIIENDYKGKFPKSYEEMLRLPGIGPYTAGAIVAFAYNKPVSMIETNIRRVYLYHFFKTENRRLVHDKELIDVINQTCDEDNSREWYYALMDYGAHLGKTISNPNRKSRHYVVQKKFKGSDREIRGKILELLLKKKYSLEKLVLALKDLSEDVERIEKIIDQLDHEGFLTIKKGRVILTS